MSRKIFDEAERRVIIVAPCLFNLSLAACGFYSKNSFEIRKDFLPKLLDICFSNLVSVDVYKCPEYSVMKLPRPNSSKEFYERYKKEIKKVAEELVEKIKDYQRHGIKVLAIVGIDGSPCCGVNLTKYGKIWSGEDLERFKKEYEIGKDLTEEWYKPTYSSKGKGVFIECLEKILEKEKIQVQVPLLAFSREYEQLLKKIEEIIKHS